MLDQIGMVSIQNFSLVHAVQVNIKWLSGKTDS